MPRTAAQPPSLVDAFDSHFFAVNDKHILFGDLPKGTQISATLEGDKVVLRLPETAPV